MKLKSKYFVNFVALIILLIAKFLFEKSNTESSIVEKEKKKQKISQEPPLKPREGSNNDGAAYNISPLDNLVMQKVNTFFDQAPFIEPKESSFNSSRLSNSVREDIYVPETTDEESVDERSIAESSNIGEIVYEKESETKGHREEVEQGHPNFSDNNIHVDIPVIKSTSDQPVQIIRSSSGVRLTGSRSSPIIKTSAGILTPGSKIRLNSNNGQLSIAAKININIQIVEDSSEDSSEDNKPSRKSKPIQSSEDCQANHSIASSNQEDDPSEDHNLNSNEPKQSIESRPRTPVKNQKLDGETMTKTPSTANKLKQFEFQAPRSMSKDKLIQKTPEKKKEIEKPANKSISFENSEDNDGFKVDKSIPVSPRDQKLLHKVYGDAWKTPDVIKSYSAVKGKPIDRALTNSTPSNWKNRYSKGFDLFKQKIKTNLDSTRMDECAEISMIESLENPVKKPEEPKKVKNVNTPRSKRQPNTPRSMVKTASSVKQKDFEPSPSVLTKKKPSPKSTKKKIESPKASSNEDTRISTRPKRNQGKKLFISDDEASDKENLDESWSSDTSYSAESELLTDDDSDDEYEVPKPKSVRKNAAGASTTKNSTGTSTKSKPSKKKGLVFLDLSSEEVVEVNENFHTNVSEEDLANLTRKFLETDLNNEEKPKKKTGRRLFTQPDVDDIELETTFEEPKSVKKKPDDDASLNIEIPKFTHKLFDSKIFGSPSTSRTPKPKLDGKKDELKTPASRILSERKTPFGSAKSQLDSPPKTFITYGFLKSLDVEASMMLCHPDAKKFRTNFKANKEELTTVLYNMYNEKVFDGKCDVDIIWNKKLTTTAGRFHGRKKPAAVTGKKNHIELSEKVLTSADRLRCTLIHELCHAATWIFNKETGHGARWKSWARKANDVFPELPKISVCHNYDIQYKYTYKCDLCHSKSQSHSKSKKVENIRCSYCHGSISIFLNKMKDGKMVLEPVKEASGFAKFVKEKYRDFKIPGVTHAEVMRQISLQHSALSQEEKKMY